MKKEELYRRIIKKYGKKDQIIKSIEELSELQKALCKYQLYNFPEKLSTLIENIGEEIADVEIMINQLKIIFSPEMAELVEIKKAQKHERMLLLL